MLGEWKYTESYAVKAPDENAARRGFFIPCVLQYFVVNQAQKQGSRGPKMSFLHKLFGKKEKASKNVEDTIIRTETKSEDGSKLTITYEITQETLDSAQKEKEAKAKAGHIEYFYEWRTSEKHGGRRKNPCQTCKFRDGEIHGMDYWEAVGKPRTMGSYPDCCGEKCTCELVKVGEFRYREKEHVWYEPGYATEEDMNSERKKSLVKHYDQTGQVFWKEGL